MSVNDAKPNDIYVDSDGKLWRVVGICGEPTVTMQEIESATPDSPIRKSGGVSGYMWSSFKRVHRQPEPAPKPAETRSGVHRQGNWHYDSQGYCDNPGRGY